MRTKTESNQKVFEGNQERRCAQEENIDHQKQDKDSDQGYAEEESRSCACQDLLQLELQEKLMIHTVLLFAK